MSTGRHRVLAATGPMQHISATHRNRGTTVVPVASGTSMMRRRSSAMRGGTVAAAGDEVWRRVSTAMAARIGGGGCIGPAACALAGQGGTKRPIQRTMALSRSASSALSLAPRFDAAASPPACRLAGRRPMMQLTALPRVPMPVMLETLRDRGYTALPPACRMEGRRSVQLRALPPGETPVTLVEILRDRSYTAPAHIARRQVSEGEWFIKQ